MQSILDRLGRIPVPIAGAMLALGGILADAHVVLSGQLDASGAEEWPQWLGRLTIMQYWLLIPLGLLALWARRRHVQRRLGGAAAVLLGFGALCHLLATVMAIAWGGILGNGDFERAVPFWGEVYYWADGLMLVSYVGVLLAGVAHLLDRAVARYVGVLVILGFFASFVLPGLMALTYVALAILLAVRGLVARPRISVNAPATVV